MIERAKTHLIHDDSGAVTTDWVLLTAGIIGLSLAVVGAITGGVGDLSTDLESTLSQQTINGSF
jgi:hypothetical protein